MLTLDLRFAAIHSSCPQDITFLILSSCTSIYNHHTKNAFTTKCRRMCNKFSFTFLQLCVDHMLLLATVIVPTHWWMVFLLSSTIQYPQQESLEKWIPFICYRESQVYVMASGLSKPGPSGLKKRNIISCVMGMKKLLVLWWMKKIDIDDEIDLKIKAETASEESNEEQSKVVQVVWVLLGGKLNQWVIRNPRNTPSLRTQGPNWTFCQMLSPWIISVYFSMISFWITLLPKQIGMQETHLQNFS